MVRSRPAIFLDRDGVVNEEVHHLHRVEDLRLLPGAAWAIRRVNELGIPVLLVTNQSVIARGLCTPKDVETIHRTLGALLAEEGAHLDGIFSCPHHPEGLGPYRRTCRCRKPEPGLLMRAAREFHLDLRRSVLIGDQVKDLEAGRRAGCRVVLVLTGHGREALLQHERHAIPPDCVAQNLEEAVDWCLRHLDWRTGGEARERLVGSHRR